MSMTPFRPNRRELLGGASVLAAAASVPGAAGAQEEAAEPDLNGKSVLITGCSSGFGRLAALHMARRGATVIASLRNLDGGNRPEAVELKETAAQDNLPLSIVEIDVTDDAQVASGVAAAEEIAGGAIDVLINNAGIALSGPVEINDMEATRLIFDTNLYGYLRMARAVLPKMRAKKAGQILCITSQLGRFLLPTVGMYSATKFAGEAMFEAMAYEMVPFGVEVTIIEPGGYPTKIWENGRRYIEDLLSRVSEEEKEAFAVHLEIANRFLQSNPPTDPMDVPRAMAAIIAQPQGSRPLRKVVHPNPRLAEAANEALAQIQAQVLSQGPFAAWHSAVTD